MSLTNLLPGLGRFGVCLTGVICLAGILLATHTIVAAQSAEPSPLAVAPNKVTMPKIWQVEGQPYEVRKILKIQANMVRVETDQGPRFFAANTLPPKVLEIFQQKGHFLGVKPAVEKSTSTTASEQTPADSPSIDQTTARQPILLTQSNASSSTVDAATRKRSRAGAVLLFYIGLVIEILAIILAAYITVQVAGWGWFCACCIPVIGQLCSVYLFRKHRGAFTMASVIHLVAVGFFIWSINMAGGFDQLTKMMAKH